MKEIIIKNGFIVNAGEEFHGDILVSDGKIKAIGAALDVAESEVEVIEAKGLTVTPGGVDPHVHMELPVGDGLVSSDDFETGTRAALAGGTTTIIDFVTPEPGQPLVRALEERKAAARKSLCDYGLHMSITAWEESIPQQVKQCIEKEGTPSFKVYMAYKQAIGLDDGPMIRVMDTVGRAGGRVMVHCEPGELVDYLRERFIAEGKTAPRYHPLSRPPEFEKEAVVRALMMGRKTDCPLYIVHVSTIGAAAAVVEYARAYKHDVFAETCPHYLLLQDSLYAKPGFAGAAYVMSPPLRGDGHNDFLWKALEENQLDVVATDHCPFHMKGQKDRGKENFTLIPNGVAGVEHRMGLIYTFGVVPGVLSLCRWVDVCAAAPARIFGLYPRKGVLCEGADADIVLWDTSKETVISAQTHVTNCDTNIYEGMPLKAVPHMVIANGKIVMEKGRVSAQKGNGRFLYRQKNKL